IFLIIFSFLTDTSALSFSFLVLLAVATLASCFWIVYWIIRVFSPSENCAS
ncbi:hypothetical protein S83_032078, partial [Arachis hypogaea]